ncbi:hypothetical protein [Actinoplanes sp. NPDC048796]|uniref:hypothetical protein n=1 Tax=unclassified Actinoplanes TaxID=2626549 RepID=UPI0034070492
MEPIGDPDEQEDFAAEHDSTAVDEQITADEDDGETEGPRGWSGLEQDGPP